MRRWILCRHQRVGVSISAIVGAARLSKKICRIERAKAARCDEKWCFHCGIVNGGFGEIKSTSPRTAVGRSRRKAAGSGQPDLPLRFAALNSARIGGLRQSTWLTRSCLSRMSAVGCQKSVVREVLITCIQSTSRDLTRLNGILSIDKNMSESVG